MFNQEIKNENVVYVFIDASNLWDALKAKGKFLDFERAMKYIKEKFNGTTIKAFYYTAYPAEGTRSYSLDGKHRFFTFLKKQSSSTMPTKTSMPNINTLTWALLRLWR